MLADCLSEPHAGTLVLAEDAMQPDLQCRPTQALRRAGIDIAFSRAGLSPGRSQQASTRWRCCSAANWCMACFATWRCHDGGATRRRRTVVTTRGCAWMSWHTARRRWRNTTLHSVAALPPRIARGAGPAPLPAPPPPDVPAPAPALLSHGARRVPDSDSFPF